MEIKLILGMTDIHISKYITTEGNKFITGITSIKNRYCEFMYKDLY